MFLIKIWRQFNFFVSTFFKRDFFKIEVYFFLYCPLPYSLPSGSSANLTARRIAPSFIGFFFYSGEGCFYTREKIKFSEITRLGVTRVINFWKITRWNLLVFHKKLVRFYSISSNYSILIYSFFQKKWKLLDISCFLINFGIFQFLH